MKRFFRKNKSSRKGRNQEYVFLDLSNDISKSEGNKQIEKTMLEKGTEYRDMFSNVEAIGLRRKAVYVDLETHKLVSEIVKRFDVRGVSIGVFIENIIRLHIKEHKEELLSMCLKKENIINDLFAKYNDD
jgi:Protein of unknown function (DUF3408).